MRKVLPPVTAKLDVSIDDRVNNNVSDRVNDMVNNNVNDRVNNKVSDTQRYIVLMMRENPKITAKEMALRLKITERNVRNNIRRLKESGIVGRVGER